MVFVAFFCFAAGVVCGVIATPECYCKDCRRQRWHEGEEV